MTIWLLIAWNLLNVYEKIIFSLAAVIAFAAALMQDMLSLAIALGVFVALHLGALRAEEEQ
jgi:hypothetical protein